MLKMIYETRWNFDWIYGQSCSQKYFIGKLIVGEFVATESWKMIIIIQIQTTNEQRMEILKRWVF